MTNHDHSPQLKHCCDCCKREDDVRRYDTLMHNATSIVTELTPGSLIYTAAEAYLTREFTKTDMSALPKL